LGGRVRAGEKSTPVVFWRIYLNGVEVKASDQCEPDRELKERLGKRRYALRYYTVFNTEQCVLPKSVAKQLIVSEGRTLDPIEACEGVLAAMPNPPQIQHTGDKAFYSPRTDCITMPPTGVFESADEYWSTLWHEAGHATGHPKRLNRAPFSRVVPFGEAVYSKEELLAEMTAAYLCGITGIQSRTVEESAAYVVGWLNNLRSDRKLIVYTAAQAQRACDYILQTRAGCSTPPNTEKAIVD
jgi:antirestriction protein ArdC